MQDPGHMPDPDVNSYIPDIDPGASRKPEKSRDEGQRDDIEGTPDERDVVPVPPDSPQIHPVEEPSTGDEVPIGDVDDSPKRIA